MKRLLLPFIAFTVAVGLIAGCSGESKTDVDTRTGVNVVETISTGVNQEFSVARVFDLNSGYMWREDYDERMLELIESTIDTEKRGETKIVLLQVFRFKALKKGKTEIMLVNRRETLEGPVIARQEVINVNIE